MITRPDTPEKLLEKKPAGNENILWDVVDSDNIYQQNTRGNRNVLVYHHPR